MQPAYVLGAQLSLIALAQLSLIALAQPSASLALASVWLAFHD